MHRDLLIPALDNYKIQQKLDGKYSERVQLPAKAKYGGFVGYTCHTYY